MRCKVLHQEGRVGGGSSFLELLGWYNVFSGVDYITVQGSIWFPE